MTYWLQTFKIKDGILTKIVTVLLKDLKKMNVDDFSRSKKLKIICYHKKMEFFGKALEINKRINLPVIYITSMKILLYHFYYLGSSAGEMVK